MQIPTESWQLPFRVLYSEPLTGDLGTPVYRGQNMDTPKLSFISLFFTPMPDPNDMIIIIERDA